MRILAIDPGTRRVGLAISDETGTIASPIGALAAEPADTLPGRLAVVAREHDAVRIVLGLPLGLDGARGAAAAAAERLATELRKASGLPVETMDERLTTAAAERALIAAGMRREKRKKTVDSVAASLLLQTYIDRRSR